MLASSDETPRARPVQLVAPLGARLLAGATAGAIAGLIMSLAMMAYANWMGRSIWTNPNVIELTPMTFGHVLFGAVLGMVYLGMCKRFAEPAARANPNATTA